MNELVNEKRYEIAKQLGNYELTPIKLEQDFSLQNTTKVSMTDIASLGSVFTEVAKSLGTSAGSGLYKVTLPAGTHLAEKGTEYIGAALSNSSNQLVGQARLNPAGVNPLMANPYMLMIAVALKCIDKKLTNLLEGQEAMMDFLLQQEKATQRSNLNMLTEIINNYKYNWDNELFIKNNHMKVLDIKQGWRAWCNFHSDYKYQKDYKLRYALRGTKYWGCYITDIIKRYAEVDSSKVELFLREHPEVVEYNIREFERELELIGGAPKLVALGGTVFNLLTKYIGKQYTIYKVPHYSSYISAENYRNQVLDALGRNSDKLTTSSKMNIQKSYNVEKKGCKVKYIFPNDLKEKLKQILDGSCYFIREGTQGHEDVVYISPIDSQRTRIAEFYISNKGLTIYPSSDYLKLADLCVLKQPVFHEKYVKQFEYFVTEEEMIEFSKLVSLN